MKRILVYYYARIGGVYRELFLTFPWAIKFLYVPGFNKLRNFNSRARAYYQFRNAKKSVPAYKAFLKERSFNEPRFKGFVPLIEDIPWMDKDNYIKKFDMDSRCIDGQIPERNIIFDESSGSSGTATNWVRGKTERKRNAKIIRFGFETLFGKEPHFIVNAFALGPWATGVNVTMSCVPFSRLKSLGPEKTKIENTLLQFGTKYKYVVMGYPPFLKQLVEGDTVPWQDYDISFIFGGESMSEGMRDFLYARGIKKVYSSLGASDLELNIGSENDFTISVRRLMRSNEKLRARLMRHEGALPMIFQYNPSDFLVQNSEEGELIITVCRFHYVAPKVRYNIHDRGHQVTIKELFELFEELGIDKSEITLPRTDLPLLFHYGRADMTVAFFGANISPVDVQESMFEVPILVERCNTFQLSTSEDATGDKTLEIRLEAKEGVHWDAVDEHKVKMALIDQLVRINQDFRAAYGMSGQERVSVELLEHNEGDFANNDIRIKARYLN